MTPQHSDAPAQGSLAAQGTTRRGFLARGALAGAGALSAAALAGGAGGVALERSGALPGAPDRLGAPGREPPRVVPFYGPHQAGITAIPGTFASFVALDLAHAVGQDRLRAWLRILTDDAARLTQGLPALADMEPELAASPSGLTVTIGFGQGLVARAGAEAPEWLAPLPPFTVDRLEDRWCGGDVLLLVASDDRTTTAHAVRMLLKDSRAFATLRWRQDGFRGVPGPDPHTSSMRNLFGQVDGTANPAPGSADFDAAVWARDDAPAWLLGGTSFVLRRIAMDLDAWDAVDRTAREASVGRRLDTGAPLTGTKETDPLDLGATLESGLPVISSVAHARRAHVTDPALRIARLGYNYEGPAPAGGEALSDSGLLFGSWQADVTAQYVPIQRALDEADLLNVWTTPIGSAVFAIPPGCAEGGFIGQTLWDRS